MVEGQRITGLLQSALRSLIDGEFAQALQQFEEEEQKHHVSKWEPCRMGGVSDGPPATA